MEINKENFECNIYVDAEEELSTIRQDIAKLFYANTTDILEEAIYISQGDIHLNLNKDYSKTDKKSPEDGFLFYRYRLKVKPNQLLGRENAIKFISKILDHFWVQDYPAIAFCDFEKKLPNKGGYKSPKVPSPK